MNTGLNCLLKEINGCDICRHHLPIGPNPVLAVKSTTRILIIGQAPGKKVHDTGIPWNDKSGDNLKDWLGVSEGQFRNVELIGTMPMGFCYPGSSKTGSGDAPPRKECAEKWHASLLAELKDVELILLVGQYAINHYLRDQKKRNLTETVRNYHEYLPKIFPIVHPSPLNYRWHAKNKWFKEDVLPVLKLRVQEIIDEDR